MKDTFIKLGPPIPVISVRDFSKFKLTSEEWDKVWRIVGPSVERNMQMKCPLWRVIAAAYLEGLQHGSALAREERDACSAVNSQ